MGRTAWLKITPPGKPSLMTRWCGKNNVCPALPLRAYSMRKPPLLYPWQYCSLVDLKKKIVLLYAGSEKLYVVPLLSEKKQVVQHFCQNFQLFSEKAAIRRLIYKQQTLHFIQYKINLPKIVCFIYCTVKCIFKHFLVFRWLL